MHILSSSHPQPGAHGLFGSQGPEHGELSQLLGVVQLHPFTFSHSAQFNLLHFTQSPLSSHPHPGGQGLFGSHLPEHSSGSQLLFASLQSHPSGHVPLEHFILQF